MILMILKTWMSRMIMRGLRITRGRGATSSSRFMSCMQVEEGADAEYADTTASVAAAAAADR